MGRSCRSRGNQANVENISRDITQYECQWREFGRRSRPEPECEEKASKSAKPQDSKLRLQGNKLTAMMVVRNEAGRFLVQVLDDLTQWVDEIVILDDASL
ncbi:MAG: hypothetical protein HPY71_09020 [Firmicutes bacterium]|nr:hypothetical protein [Bacillota bacterium]